MTYDPKVEYERFKRLHPDDKDEYERVMFGTGSKCARCGKETDPGRALSSGLATGLTWKEVRCSCPVNDQRALAKPDYEWNIA